MGRIRTKTFSWEDSRRIRSLHFCGDRDWLPSREQRRSTSDPPGACALIQRFDDHARTAICGFRAKQGTWSRRRDAHPTTKAGLDGGREPAGAWLLHAYSGHAPAVAAFRSNRNRRALRARDRDRGLAIAKIRRFPIAKAIMSAGKRRLRGRPNTRLEEASTAWSDGRRKDAVCGGLPHLPVRSPLSSVPRATRPPRVVPRRLHESGAEVHCLSPGPSPSLVCAY